MTPEALKRANPPYKNKLHYRAGAYADFLEHMERIIHRRYIPGIEQTIENPLRHIDLDADYDLAAALLKSWAVVGDILTFYQERIANEGYIRTAVERKSVMELVRTISYRLKPGLAASTYLQFTVTDAKGAPLRVQVPVGAAVQGIPGEGKKPVTFETVEAFEARPEWNRMEPYIASKIKPQKISVRDNVLRLDGKRTGLKPGAHILITGWEPDTAKDAEPSCFFRTVQKVEVVEKKEILPRKIHPRKIKDKAEQSREVTFTQVHLVPAPVVPEPGDRGPVAPPYLEDPRVYAFTQQTVLFGQNAPDWKTLPAPVKQEHGTLRGGVYYSGDGDDWTPAGNRLPQYEIRALAMDSSGCMVVGTRMGVYRSLDQGCNWKAVNSGLTRRDVHSLYFDPSGHLFAGTSGGNMFRSTDRGGGWEIILGSLSLHKSVTHWKVVSSHLPKTVVRSIIAHEDPESGDVYIFAGTDNGIMRSRNNDNAWEPVNKDLPGENEKSGLAGVVVYDFTVYPDQSYLFAATDKGVFRAKKPGQKDGKDIKWKKEEKGLDAQTIYALESCTVTDKHKHHFFGGYKTKNYLFAGTDNGVFISEDDGRKWKPSPLPVAGKDDGKGSASPGPTVRALALVDDAAEGKITLFAGTWRGILRSEDLGQDWTPVGRDTVTGPVHSLAGALSGTAGPSGKTDDADSSIKGGRAAPVIGGCVTPFEGFEEKEWPHYHIKEHQADLMRARSGIVSGSWVVLTQEEPEALTRCHPVGEVSSLVRDDYSRSARVTRVQLPQDKDLKCFDLRQTRVFVQSRRLPLFEERAPELMPLKDKSVIKVKGIVEGLEHRRAVAVTGRLRRDEEGTGRAGGDEEDVSEVHRIVDTQVSKDRIFTEIRLERPFKLDFDPQTVTLSANVAYAVHGETVSGEVLGSGDASKANQVFTLKKPPLTYVSAPIPGGAQSTLSLRVTGGSSQQFAVSGETPVERHDRGMRWRETPTLYNAGPVSREYMVENDEDHKAHVVFGDGKNGARPATGVENITAVYRSGGGAEGNMPAGKLKILKTRPAGLRKAVNPVPAAGGADPESPKDARVNAPLSVRSLGRIVSRGDYEDFSRLFDGIDRARAKPLWDGKTTIMHVTVAGAGGAVVDKGSNLYNNLTTAIHDNRAIDMPVRVESFVQRCFNLSARVIYEPDSDPEKLEKRIRAALREHFGFAQRDLAQDAAASEVTARVQDIPGVRAVRLEAFHFKREKPALDNVLEASEAVWDPRRKIIRPARMVIINPDDTGIVLTMQEESR